ncbi:adenosine deaminase/editase [Gigaspora margarita]|uniref:Adenosine deaminase/editase n=1 Tax=Gigaspora margarita TaxID=4874 RepID=A0A8H4B1C7_GIGMA|nr:adenosine deaminase/editase [Gigaspora margarita]
MTRNQTSDCNIEVSKMKDGFRRGRVDSEPTLSMTCSDKIAQWNVVGLQSAIISELISPIYLSSITVGDMFYLEDLNRALYERIQDITNLPHESYLSEGLLDKDLIPSNIATIWIKGSESAEVLVSGRKQGATKSKKNGLHLFKTRSSVTKLSLFQDLESLLVQIPKSLVPQNLIKFTNQDLRKAFTYNMLKLASKNYKLLNKH